MVLNKYPLWKSLMVLFIVAIGALYALPNLYGEDPAVQISGLRGVEITTSTLDTVKDNSQPKKFHFQRLFLITAKY